MESLLFYDEAATSQDTMVVATVPIGTVAPRSSDDTVLRVFNPNDNLMAKAVTVSVGGDDAAQLFVSLDGDTFSDDVLLGDLPPNGASAGFTVRRVTASTVTAGTYSATLTATPAQWVAAIDTTGSDNIALPTTD